MERAFLGKFDLSLQVFLVACVQCWVELTTTFPSYNAQPRTEKEAQDAGWTKIEDDTDRYVVKKSKYAGLSIYKVRG